MEVFITFCGFAGAWLLVAGPIYQASLELRDETIEQEHIDATRKKLPHPHSSAWWWLLPPVKIVLERHHDKVYRKAFLDALPAEDVADLLSFLNKATGWIFVATGGGLLAIKESYELTQELELNLIYFVGLVITMAIISVGYTAQRTARSERVLAKRSSN